MRYISERSTDPGLLVLASLAEGPKHGYAITQDVEEVAGVKLGPGTLYGALSRLEGRDLIEPLPSEDRRRPYKITAAGAAALERAAADARPRRRDRDEAPARRGGDLMNARLARLALALYPLAYRRRYGDEMAALLEDSPVSPAAVVDLLRGAARAHLRPEPAVAAEVGPEERLRLGLSSVLLCWVLFALAGLALYKTTENGGPEAGGGPALLGGLHTAIQVLAALGSAAVIVGAAPLVLIALKEGARRPELRRLARRASAYVATIVAATVALVLVAGGDATLAGGVDALILSAWSLIALVCGVGCAKIARRGLLAIDVPGRVLRLASACAAAVVAAMVGIAALTAAYLVTLAVAAPGFAGEANGPLGTVSVATSLAIALAAMLVISAPAAVGFRRAWAR